MSTENATESSEGKAVAYQTPQRIEGETGLYWRGGMIYARVRVDGKQTFRCTGTDKLPKARKVLAKWREDQVMRHHGIEPRAAALAWNRLTVAEVLREYEAAGFPDRKNRTKKTEKTRRTEGNCLLKLKSFFGTRAAASLTFKDCDDYRKWRASGGYTWKTGETVRRSRAANRTVDIDLQTLGNALALAKRQEKLKLNPLAGRQRYHSEGEGRHSRDRAPTVQQLQFIVQTLRQRGQEPIADCLMFLGLSGLRVDEALPLSWEDVAWAEGVVHVRREKNGCNPFVPITAELGDLLRQMKARAKSFLLFPSTEDPQRPLPYPTIAVKFRKLTKKLELPHLCLHGLRAFFITRARESGLSDWVIAGLVGQRTGGILIARAYGQVREQHLLKQAQQVRFMVEAPQKKDNAPTPEAAAA